MKKLAFILAILTIISLISVLPVSADSGYTVSVTDGKESALTDPSVRNYWNPASADSKVTITLKSGRKTDGIYISWYTEDSVFTITATDSGGKVVNRYKNGDRYDGYSCFYPLDEAAQTVVIAMPGRGESAYGITYLSLSEKGKTDPDMMKWTDPGEKCNLLVVATHQDDEFIFLGGVIPKYIDAGYSVALAYTATCGRLRIEEGLNGIWQSGIRSYPDFMDYPDKGRMDTFDEAADVWGGMDAVVKAYVRELRRRKPEVVVSHDENGENYHNSHKVTAAALKQAVELAADPGYDPESAGKYGAWQVSKLYLHLYSKNQIQLDYRTPLASYGGRTAIEVAADAYACHVSQKEFYSVTQQSVLPGAKYDNSLFGCVFSKVGYDSVDLFYGTPVYRGDAASPNPPADQPEVTTSSRQTAPQTTPQTTPVTTPEITQEPTETAPDTDGTTQETASSAPETTLAATPVGTESAGEPQTSAPFDSAQTSGQGAATTAETTSPIRPYEEDENSKNDSQTTIILAVSVAAFAGIAVLAAVIIMRRKSHRS